MENFLDVLIEKLVAMKAAGEQPNAGDVIKVVIGTAIDLKLPFDTKKTILQAILAIMPCWKAIFVTTWPIHPSMI